MTVRELKKFLRIKNNALRPFNKRVCVNAKSAYYKNYVPVTSSLNLNQNQILTHIAFDIGNSTLECNNKIEERLERAKKEQLRRPPIQWTNTEYVMPIVTLFLLFLASITVNCMLCFRLSLRSGPRRENYELANRS